ncbi:hypothetical protein FJY63_10555, partial [Candidatus Sumerlaeota bacterium]|nr:hypothetical protein [Candidatus Sumerlaeota bacterium]
MTRERFLIALSVLVLWAGLGMSGMAAPTNDRRRDANYLDSQIKHISDANLFAALDLNRPGLAAVKEAADAGDYPAAYRAWADYWTAKDKITLVEYERELRPIAEVETALRADPAQRRSLIRQAERVMRHEITGWGSVTHQ